MYEPMRICSVCRKKSPKTELLRVVRIGDEYIVDTTGKAQGRGAYICKSTLTTVGVSTGLPKPDATSFLAYVLSLSGTFNIKSEKF